VDMMAHNSLIRSSEDIAKLLGCQKPQGIAVQHPE
jgi:hypothetical protein